MTISMTIPHSMKIKNILAALAAMLATAVTLIAQTQPQPQSEFVPVNSLPPADQLPAAPLLVIAYAFVWVAVLVYLWSISRRLSKVNGEIEALRRSAPKGSVSR